MMARMTTDCSQGTKHQGEGSCNRLSPRFFVTLVAKQHVRDAGTGQSLDSFYLDNTESCQNWHLLFPRLH